MNGAIWISQLAERAIAVVLIVSVAPMLAVAYVLLSSLSAASPLVRVRFTTTGGREVEVIKFRTRLPSEAGARAGLFLDHFSLAEFPMLFSVVKGDIGLYEWCARNRRNCHVE